MAHLVFQTAFPGDLFLSIPLLKRIREWDPTAHLVLACRPGLGQFFQTAGLVDEILEIDKRSPEGRRLARKTLRREKWDIVFVPHQSVRTALWMLPVKAKRKIGFRLWWNFPFYSDRVQKPMHLPDALRQMSLLAPVDDLTSERFANPQIQDLSNPQTEESPLTLAAVPDWGGMQVRFPSQKEPRIFLAPGSVWDTKRWTKNGYLELSKQLIAKGFRVELVGSLQEKALCNEIVKGVPGVINHAGETTLGELVHLLATGTALVCNDSGAMHAAAVAGLPTVAIFGPTTLAQGFRPWQNQAIVVQRRLQCRPCGKHGAKKCPIGTHECMEAVKVADVMDALGRATSSTL